MRSLPTFRVQVSKLASLKAGKSNAYYSFLNGEMQDFHQSPVTAHPCSQVDTSTSLNLELRSKSQVLPVFGQALFRLRLGIYEGEQGYHLGIECFWQWR